MSNHVFISFSEESLLASTSVVHLTKWRQLSPTRPKYKCRLIRRWNSTSTNVTYPDFSHHNKCKIYARNAIQEVPCDDELTSSNKDPSTSPASPDQEGDSCVADISDSDTSHPTRISLRIRHRSVCYDDSAIDLTVASLGGLNVLWYFVPITLEL